MAFFNEFPHTRNYDADLGWLIESMRKLIECCEEVQAWKTNHEDQYEELKTLYDQIMSGHFPDAVQDAFKKWMQQNAADIVGEMIKMVFFGLTDSGYFVAYIPESWEDIIFKTSGWDITISGTEYGHLVLSY